MFSFSHRRCHDLREISTDILKADDTVTLVLSETSPLNSLYAVSLANLSAIM